jgi:hypothetical protein
MTVQELRKEYPQGKRRPPSLWTPSFSVENGASFQSNHEKYREEQKNK